MKPDRDSVCSTGQESQQRAHNNRLLSSVLIMSLCTLWIGCSAERNYKTLSFFFDGVPDPASAKVNPNAGSGLSAGMPKNNKPTMAHQHKPYAEGNCAACHVSEKKIDVARVAETCLACHQNVKTQYAVIHQPVALGECLWCHLPHESNEPKLLVASAPQLCRQCHETRSLSSNPPEHQDPAKNCSDCHLSHGGATGNLLKPGNIPSTLPSRGGPP